MKTLFAGYCEGTSSKHNGIVKHQYSEVVYIKNVIMFARAEPLQRWNQNGFRHASSTMTLMRELACITEGMKGTQLSLAIGLYTSRKPLTTYIGNAYLIYFVAYEISPSSVELEKAYQTGMCNIEDWVAGCHTGILSDDRTK